MKEKINFLMLLANKKELANYLHISRKTLYNKANNNNWKEYQIKKIEKLYDLVVKHKGEVYKIEIDENVVAIKANIYKIHTTSEFKML